jgi:hypothetical protein
VVAPRFDLSLRRDCPRHQIAQFTRAIQTPSGWIWAQALGNCFDPCVYRAVDQLAYIGSYPQKAARVG